MIIQSTNTQTLMSGLDSNTTSTAALTDTSSNSASGAFNSSFLLQLAQLQTSISPNVSNNSSLLADLQTAETTGNIGALQQDMQSFAALFGKTPPMASNMTANINLDATLNTLADILQNLQAIKTGQTADNSQASLASLLAETQAPNITQTIDLSQTGSNSNSTTDISSANKSKAQNTQALTQNPLDMALASLLGLQPTVLPVTYNPPTSANNTAVTNDTSSTTTAMASTLATNNQQNTLTTSTVKQQDYQFAASMQSALIPEAMPSSSAITQPLTNSPATTLDSRMTTIQNNSKQNAQDFINSLMSANVSASPDVNLPVSTPSNNNNISNTASVSTVTSTPNTLSSLTNNHQDIKLILPSNPEQNLAISFTAGTPANSVSATANLTAANSANSTTPTNPAMVDQITINTLAPQVVQVNSTPNRLSSNTSTPNPVAITPGISADLDTSILSSNISQLTNNNNKNQKFNSLPNLVSNDVPSSNSATTTTNQLSQTPIAGVTPSTDTTIATIDQAITSSTATDKLSSLVNEKTNASVNIGDKVNNAVPTTINQFHQALPADKSNVQTSIATPLNHPNWNNELGEKLLWMHTQQLPSAEISINPPHLGPITIKIDLDQNQTSIVFTTQHAEVKSAIEASLPTLREMLGNQQLSLVDVNVSQQQAEQKPNQGFFQMGSGQNNGNNNRSQYQGDDSTNSGKIAKVGSLEAPAKSRAEGLLNLFA